MFIRDEGLAVPELLDAVLLRLSENDLYHCLLVNRQFYHHAFPILYRTTTLYLHPGSIYGMRFARRARYQLGKQFKACIDFTIHIVELRVTLNDPLETSDFETRFLCSILTVISKATRVKKIDLSDLRDDKSEQDDSLEIILKAISNNPASPELSLRVKNTVDPNTSNFDAVFSNTGINENLVALEIPPFEELHLRDFLQTCTKLRLFNFRRYVWWPDETGGMDLSDAFSQCPLQKLLHIPPIFRSLPRTLRYLHCGHPRDEGFLHPLMESAWVAICNLEHLETLIVRFKLFQWSSYVSPRFHSSKLKFLRLEMGRDKPDLFLGIIEPILDRCSHLRHINLNGMRVMPHLIRSIFETRPNLMTLVLSPAMEQNDCGSVNDLVEKAPNTPFLRRLSIPWSSENTRFNFESCRILAQSFPSLDIIKLKFHKKHRWQNYQSSVAWRDFIQKTRPQVMHVVDETRKSSKIILYSQDLKLSVYVDLESSLCLDLCSIVMATKRTGTWITSFKLSLNRFRQHLMRYFLSTPLIDYSCSEDHCILRDGSSSLAIFSNYLDPISLKEWNSWQEKESDKFTWRYDETFGSDTEDDSSDEGRDEEE